MRKKLSNIAGVTLIEILIGILISVVMMGAMFTSYTVVNNTYSQVTDRAKISTAGRDVVGMIMREILEMLDLCISMIISKHQMSIFQF